LFRLNWERPKHRHAANSHQVVRLDQLIQEYFETGRANFHEVEIDPSGWTEFSRRIYNGCRTIEAGETLSYKELARRAGNEKASRAVGTAMAKNRVTIVIPCHRVVASGGKLGGYGGRGGIETKKFLLNLEQGRQILAS
jgi:methylated-DNA-[protein]-cysteine S-methyltransferase